MRTRLFSGGLFLLAVVTLAGCASKSSSSDEGEATKQKAASKADSSNGSAVAEKSSASKGGKGAGPKERDPVVDGQDTIPADAATELTRLNHKAFVVFYKGFSESQMKAYIDHIDKHYGMGMEPRRSYGIFSYQADITKLNQGMRIVREDGFTKITIPVQNQFRKPKDDGAKRNFAALGLPVCGSLVKIDPTVSGKVAYATSNDDWTVIYIAGDKFSKN